jgi:hypothetical protein
MNADVNNVFRRNARVRLTVRHTLRWQFVFEELRCYFKNLAAQCDSNKFDYPFTNSFGTTLNSTAWNPNAAGPNSVTFYVNEGGAHGFPE